MLVFVPVHEVNNPEKLMSVDDLAMFFNITERELVEELLESYTDYTDEDIIKEIINILDLKYICVMDNQKLCGFIRGGAA